MPTFKYYLALCLICKDENEYLPEWLDYHRRVGVEHFYIYDNNSRVPLKKTIAEYVKRGLADVFLCRDKRELRQLGVYRRCCRRFANQNRWIGFIDTDEFLVPIKARSLPAILKKYEKYAALGVNWLMFGSSGFKKKPAGGVLKNFVWRSRPGFPPNNHIKSIVNPRLVTGNADPHAFSYRRGFCVNENRERIDGPFSPHSSKIIRINHYFLRSREEFREKVRRGRADLNQKRKLDEFAENDAYCNEVKDTLIRRFCA